MAHPVAFFNFVNSIIVLWTSNCHQGLRRQTGEKQMGELSLLSQTVKWDEKKYTLHLKLESKEIADW